MTVTKTQNMQKVTITIPSSMKEKADELKKGLNISLNSLFKKALEEYIKKIELKKWEEGAKKASQNKDYIKTSKEFDITDKFYEY